MLDVQRFWEMVIFSWLTGNSDMHCKNFSLIERDDIGYQLSPAYDLLSVLLTGINDPDELAMPLSGTAEEGASFSGLGRSSFIDAMTSTGITTKVAEKIIDKLISYRDKWFALIDSSFLTDELKEAYRNLLDERLSRL
jgi:serine/threonine-protein kinase HipA